MADSESSEAFCTYCLDPLLNEFEKFHKAHTDCTKEFEASQEKHAATLDLIEKTYPDHEFYLFLEPKMNLKTLGMFSQSQFDHIQAKLARISAQHKPGDKFLIVFFHSSEIAMVVLNQIDKLPDFLFSFHSLLYLGVRFTSTAPQLETFSLIDFPDLLCLDITILADYPFPTITSSGKPIKLKFLKLTQLESNKNTKVPDGIESCHDLELLQLDIPIDEYPTSLCYLSKLRSLEITGTRSNWELLIPNTIVNLTSLHTLRVRSLVKPQNIDANQSEALLENINTLELTNITVEHQVLNLQTYQIEGFVMGYDELFPILQGKKLTEISITHCDLDEVSEEFIIFESLKKLDLSFNRITEIPDIIRRFGSIETLAISHNKISDITPLTRMYKIRSIDASYNNIETVPEKLVTKKKISLNLEGNTLTNA